MSEEGVYVYIKFRSLRIIRECLAFAKTRPMKYVGFHTCDDYRKLFRIGRVCSYLRPIFMARKVNSSTQSAVEWMNLCRVSDIGDPFPFSYDVPLYARLLLKDITSNPGSLSLSLFLSRLSKSSTPNGKKKYDGETNGGNTPSLDIWFFNIDHCNAYYNDKCTWFVVKRRYYAPYYTLRATYKVAKLAKRPSYKRSKTCDCIKLEIRVISPRDERPLYVQLSLKRSFPLVSSFTFLNVEENCVTRANICHMFHA